MAAEKIGLPVEKDRNNPRGPANGLFNIEQMISPAGFRCSVYEGYVPKSVAVERKSRLTICTGAVAIKLDVTNDGIAKGVQILDYRSNVTRQCYVKANREIIVCCGTMYTPQLLMLR
jgi:choline dehydrogenase-like flavoprotein